MTTTPVLLETPAGLVERPVRPWHRVLTKLRARSLDLRISDRESTDRDRLVAARARDLIGHRYRIELASCWQDVMIACDVPASSRSLAVPVSRTQVRSAELEINELVRTLQSRRPVSARGVAMASLVLTDGGGPVFRRTSPNLRALLRCVIDALDPSTELRILT